MPDIDKIAFGRTGHDSSRIIFGGAAFFMMRQDKADRILELLLEYGINHIDVAADYGDAELRVGAWMGKHRDRFFLASKTSARTAQEASESIERSLQRLQVDHIDLIQLHNLVKPEEWETAFETGGALEAAIQAREKGQVRFIGVTGHGMEAPHMHLRSLERFEFDSVLLPLNYMMMQDRRYADAFHRLLDICAQRRVAVQTIKAIARRRWLPDATERRFSWYEPVKDPAVLHRTIHWVLSHPRLFLNSSSDSTLLPLILKAAAEFNTGQSEIEGKQMAADARQLEMAPIFAEGMADPF